MPRKRWALPSLAAELLPNCRNKRRQNDICLVQWPDQIKKSFGTIYAESIASSPVRLTFRGQEIMQITSSTIGSLYSTTVSPRFTASTSGNRLDSETADAGSDVVTLSAAAQALAEAEKVSPDSANTAKDTRGTKTPTEAEAAHDAAVKALNDYVEKGPVVARIEAIREQVLKSMGLSEADLKNLPPEQQQQIEATIAERIKEQLMQKKADKSSTTIQQAEIAQPLLNPSRAVKSTSI